MTEIPICILEGCDFSGKSTLAREIEATWLRIKQPEDGRKPRATVAHFGPPAPRHDSESAAGYRDRLVEDLVAPLADYDYRDSTGLLVVDRLHVGSYVYGNLFRPEASVSGWGEIGPDGFQEVEDAYAQAGAVMAVLLPPLSALVKRSMGREDPYLDEVVGSDRDRGHGEARVRQLSQISASYRAFVQQHASKMWTYRRIGHPYYADHVETPWPDSGWWPSAAFETESKRVAGDVLGWAISAQVELMRAMNDTMDPDGSIRAGD